MAKSLQARVASAYEALDSHPGNVIFPQTDLDLGGAAVQDKHTCDDGAIAIGWDPAVMRDMDADAHKVGVQLDPQAP